MTEAINEFLSTVKLFRCERLSASITKGQCLINRKSGRVLSCDKCAGLGEEVQIMATHNTKCVVDGCEKFRVLGDMCTKHGKEAGREKGPKPTPEELAEIRKRQCQKMLEAKRERGLIPVKQSPSETDHELHIVNLIEIFKQKQIADLETFIGKLSEIDDAYEKLKFTLDAVQV